MKKSARIEMIALTITICPIVVISFFNHPLGDDYWLSALIRDQGFVEGFAVIYNSVTARYTALSLMGINPLVFGNFSLFKFLPLLYILLLGVAIYYLLNSIIDKNQKTIALKKDIRLISATLTITYMAVMPGIGEGLFWTSSLVVYQLSLIGLISWLTFMSHWYLHNRRTSSRWFCAALSFILVIGCNEIVGAIVCLITGCIATCIFIRMRKIDFLSITLLLLMIPCWLFIINSPSFTTRYVQPLHADINLWLQSLIDAIKYAGYHSLKCLLNPFFWSGLLILSPAIMRLNEVVIRSCQLSGRLRKKFVLAWLSTIAGIELIAILLSDNHVPPLRVTNLAVFVFLGGMLAIGILWIHSLVNRLKSPFLYKLRIGAIPGLVFAGFFFKNNISIASRELISKEAYMYDKEMQRRYALLSSCTTDTCHIPTLEYRPVILRYAPFDDDYHIGEYFKKTIVYTAPRLGALLQRHHTTFEVTHVQEAVGTVLKYKDQAGN